MEVLLYVTVFFLIFRLFIAFVNCITIKKLPIRWNNSNALISILIPARNEELNILNLLEDIESQEYQNYEVLVLDDSSNDATACMVQQFSRSHPRCRLIIGEPLPEGWLGKSWACHQLAQQAKGDFFFFLDADVRINGGLFQSALHQMHEDDLALLSLFPRQEMKTLGEWLVVPFMHFFLLSLLPLRFVAGIKTPFIAAANGQFMCFDAGRYKVYKWHEKVKHSIAEDIEIMKEVKREQLNGTTLLENEFIRCRMYRGFRDAVNGFRKNRLAGFGDNWMVYFLYLYFTVINYILFFITGNWQLFFICVLIIIFMRSMISGMADQNPLVNLLLHIPQMIVMLYIALLVLVGKLFGTMKWKGRKLHN
jgi:glycosyltransferase involved in cell wall biosynthesis